MKPIISFRNAKNKEIEVISCKIADGKCVVIGEVPEGTVKIRIGVWSFKNRGGKAGDFVTLENVQFHHILK